MPLLISMIPSLITVGDHSKSVTAPGFIVVNADGSLVLADGSSNNLFANEWAFPHAANTFNVGTLYEGFLHTNSGTWGGAAVDTWLPIDSGLTWTMTSHPGVFSALLSIRRKDTTTTIDSGTMTFTAA